MADGPFCFQNEPNQKVETIVISQNSQEAEQEETKQNTIEQQVFMSKSEFHEIRNVKSEKSAAIKLLKTAEQAQENLKKLEAENSPRLMTSSYLIVFDDYWYSK